MYAARVTVGNPVVRSVQSMGKLFAVAWSSRNSTYSLLVVWYLSVATTVMGPGVAAGTSMA